MQASDLITLVRNLLNDNVNYEASSPGIESAQSFSATMYLDACNWACKQYAIKTQATYIEVSATASTVTSLLTVPSDNLVIIRVLTDTIYVPPVVPTITYTPTLNAPDFVISDFSSIDATVSVSPTSYATISFAWSASLSGGGTINSVTDQGYNAGTFSDSANIAYSSLTFPNTISVGCTITIGTPATVVFVSKDIPYSPP